ncbi:MAG: site-2 protease family protein [Dehalococcoidia bacterium]
MIWYLSELSDNPQAFFVYAAAFAVALITGIAFHEFSHAWAANELGDNTAARQGRLTLNPIKHLDPMGTALMLMFGFGWGKPTPVADYRLKYGPIKGGALVALAGPASNFVFAVIAGLPLRLGIVDSEFGTNIAALIRFGDGEDMVWLFLWFIVWLNVLLGFFNLIPLAPLDGFAVLLGVLPRELAQSFVRLRPYGMGILMALVLIGFVTPFSPIWWLIGGLADGTLELLT